MASPIKSKLRDIIGCVIRLQDNTDLKLIPYQEVQLYRDRTRDVITNFTPAFARAAVNDKRENPSYDSTADKDFLLQIKETLENLNGALIEVYGNILTLPENPYEWSEISDVYEAVREALQEISTLEQENNSTPQPWDMGPNT